MRPSVRTSARTFVTCRESIKFTPINAAHRDSFFAKADRAGNSRPGARMKLGSPGAIRNRLDSLRLDATSRHDDDASASQDGCWGAVAKSNYTGCRWREPVYRTLRELALSYFNAYFNLRRERTLRRYSGPVNLKRFDRQNWMTTDQPVWFIVYHLFDIKHYSLMTKAQEKRLHRVDERLFQAECLGKAHKVRD